MRRLAQRSRHSLPHDPRRGHQPLPERVDVGQCCRLQPKPQAFYNSSIVNRSELYIVQIPRSSFDLQWLIRLPSGSSPFPLKPLIPTPSPIWFPVTNGSN
ncbi:hypothetical protein ACFX16_008219 [Malus domestica]